MPDARTACETCGRETRGADRCPRHLGAALVDLGVADDAAWARARRVRWWRGLALVGSIVGLFAGVALLLYFFDPRFRYASFRQDLAMVLWPALTALGLLLGVARTLLQERSLRIGASPAASPVADPDWEPLLALTEVAPPVEASAQRARPRQRIG